MLGTGGIKDFFKGGGGIKEGGGGINTLCELQNKINHNHDPKSNHNQWKSKH